MGSDDFEGTFAVVNNLSSIPYSSITCNGVDVTSSVERDGTAPVTGKTAVVDFYLTGDTINNHAFESCTLIQAINIPSIVKKLGSYSFAVGNIYTPFSLTLNEGLEEIGYEDSYWLHGRTFEAVQRCGTVVIPSTVTYIGQNSFYNFGYGQVIVFLPETPPTIIDNGEGTFGQSGVKFLVPRGTVEAYKQALGNDWGYADDVYEFDPNVTNKSIANAYAGEDGVMKIYLGATLIYSCKTCSQIGLCGNAPNCRPCTCADEGRCGDYPDCHDCTCEDWYEEGTEDYCNCVGGFWDGEECHPDWNCTDNWEDMGYSSEYDCCSSRYGDCHTCEEYGECGDYPDCYGCDPGEPCEGMEQDEADCIDRGGTWDYGTCMCNEPDPCIEDPCSCDPCLCAEPGSEEECNCQGGTWDGENCNFE